MTDILDPDLAGKVQPLVGSELAPHIPAMGQSSLFNLYCALAAINHAGAGGKLILKVPAKVEDKIEVDWQPLRNTRR